MRFIVCTWIILISHIALGQRIHIPLSAKHLQKIEKTKTAASKLKRYKKFYSRDSSRFMKNAGRVRNKIMDSVALVESLVQSKTGLPSELSQKLNAGKIPRKDYKQLLSKYGPEQAKEYVQQFNQYSDDFKKYKSKYGDINIEDLKQEKVAEGKKLLEDKLKKESSSLLNQKEISSYQKEVDVWRKEQFKYNEQLQQLGDSAYLKQQAREKAERLAMEYLENNPAILKATQAKANALMKVYSYVPNSNDLSTAVKRTSLKGRTFKERLVLGGTFQIVTIKPFIVDFFPMIGYKIKSNWSAGVGGSVRLAASDNASNLMSESFGYKGFSSYDLIKNIFAFTEFNRNSTGRASVEEGGQVQWQSSWLLGAGKKISIYHKLDMTVLALYNFFHEPGDPLYPKPFTIRVGFQLSDTALLKRRGD